jgi:hypothetical protein
MTLAERVGGGPAVDDLEVFLRLSETLLDEEDLDPGFGAECLRLVVAAGPSTYGQDSAMTPMQAMLATFVELAADPTDLASRIVAVLYADLTLGAMTRDILVAWYVGAVGAEVVSPEYYGAALIWRVLSANPPGLPGPYYGSWANPPARVIERANPGSPA